MWLFLVFLIEYVLNFELAIDYNFTQATKAYVNLANIKSEVKIGGVSDDADATYLGFGMETRF